MTLNQFARITLILGSMMFSGSIFAKNPTPVYSANITEAEVLAVQKGWGDALIQISNDFT